MKKSFTLHLAGSNQSLVIPGASFDYATTLDGSTIVCVCGNDFAVTESLTKVVELYEEVEDQHGKGKYASKCKKK